MFKPGPICLAIVLQGQEPQRRGHRRAAAAHQEPADPLHPRLLQHPGEGPLCACCAFHISSHTCLVAARGRRCSAAAHPVSARVPSPCTCPRPATLLPIPCPPLVLPMPPPPPRPPPNAMPSCHAPSLPPRMQYDPYAPGSDFVRGYPFSMREGKPTAVSHGAWQEGCGLGQGVVAPVVSTKLDARIPHVGGSGGW